MAEPTLFIGLGGSGTRTLARIKSLLRQSIDDTEMQRSYRFLFVDTEVTQIAKIEEEFHEDFGRDPDFISRSAEWVYLGGVNPYQRWRECNAQPDSPVNRDILRWLDPADARTWHNGTLEVGAKAQRQLGRFALATQIDSLSIPLSTAIRGLKPADAAGADGGLKIYVVSSSCGGTGSSIFLDTLLLTAAIYRDIAKALPRLRALVYGPKPFIRSVSETLREAELVGRYNANAHAFFTELQFCIRMFHHAKQEDWARDLFCVPSHQAIAQFKDNWLPYDGAILMEDRIDGIPPSFLDFKRGGLYDAAAEMLAGLVLAPPAKVDASIWNVAKLEDAASRSYNYYVAVGQRSTEFPAVPYRRFLAQLFLQDVVQNRFLAAPKVNETMLREEAERWFTEKVQRPFGAIDAPSFKLASEQQLFSEGSGRFAEIHSVDSFFAPPAKPEDAPEIDLTLVTEAHLEGHHREFKKRLDDLKRDVRTEFQRTYGEPIDALGSGRFSQIREDLRTWMETTIEVRGITAWAGNVQPRMRGLADFLLETCRKALDTASKTLTASNAQVSEIQAEIDGLRAAILEQADKDRGRWLRRSASDDLKSLFQQLREARRRLASEAFRNVVTMLEIELCAHVGAHDGVEPSFEAFFVGGQLPTTSFGQELRAQGERIAGWLSSVAAESGERVANELSALNATLQSKITEFRPPVEMLIGNRGEPGDTTRKALALLASAAKQRPLLLRSFSDALTPPPQKPLHWRTIRLEKEDLGARERDDYFAGGLAWISAMIRGNQDLRNLVDRPIESELGQLSASDFKSTREWLRDAKPFTLLTDTGRTAGSDFFILVTPSDPVKGSMAERLGFGSTASMEHVKNAAAPYRTRMLRYRSSLVLERDFGWFGDLKPYYDSLQRYEPHIRKEGRLAFSSEIHLSGGRDRYERAFALGLAWSLLILRAKDPASGGFREDATWIGDLFTRRVGLEPKSFLSLGPIVLEERKVCFLNTPFGPDCLDGDGRIQVKADDVRWSPPTFPERYDEAWNGFLKHPLALQNVESFHRLVAGVDHDWAGGLSRARITDPRSGAVRARLLESLPQLRQDWLTKRNELLARREDWAPRAAEVLGMVANQLELAIEELKQAENLKGAAGTADI